MSVPRSTSRIERPDRRPKPPPPAPPEPAGPLINVPDLSSGESGDSAAQPGTRRQPRPRRTPPRLADTPGPEPDTPPRQVMLTVGTIVSPHGVRGEMNVRLQSDDPEHLLTIKRLYLGDETTPRAVLGARLHAGHALIRLQGVSTPETVDRLRGLPLRMRGSDARPLAANEYFLYQVIGLEAFDEAGARLGRVTDLIETGANDVLVVTPDEGADLLLPSHPDVILELDPSAGRLVVRPLTFYGE